MPSCTKWRRTSDFTLWKCGPCRREKHGCPSNVRWFIEEEALVYADDVLRRIVDEPRRFAVQELFSFDVCAVPHRLHPDAMQVFTKAIVPLLQGGIFRQPMTEDLGLKASRFVRLGPTGYDACYATLAKEMKELWLTFDNKAHRLIEKERGFCLLSGGFPRNW